MKRIYSRHLLIAVLLLLYAPISWAQNNCSADAGILEVESIDEDDDGFELEAEFSNHPHAPHGFLLRFVLTRTDDLIIEGLSDEPEFTVTESGRYRIHSFVFPHDLDLSVVELGETTGFDVVNLLEANHICADLFVEGAIFDINQKECEADAGRISDAIEEVVEGGVRIVAEIDHAATVPNGFLLRYVLTQTDHLVIIDLGEEPTFTVEEDGRYRIHSFVFPEDLDLSVVELGETTGFDVNNLIVNNNICADLFVTGAKFDVETCVADAGRLSAKSQGVTEKGVMLTAEIEHEATVPNGFLLRYVLTQTDHLVIIDLGEEPTFTVEEDGRYRIHSFVFPEDLDLSVVELGETTGFDVNNLINENDICADLFVTGAIFDVETCAADAGRLSAKSQEVSEEGVVLTAEIEHEATVPDGFLLRYVLTQTDDLVIINLGEEPTFTVEEDGRFRIHSFVFPEDLDLSVVELGETTGFDVNNLINDNDICADLFVTGAIFDVETCAADAGRLSAKSQEVSEEGVVLTAEIEHAATVPDGFLLRYVLTQTDDLVIINLGEEPTFTVEEDGRYRIHSFVFPEDLDLSVVELGETTGFDVNNLINDNDICADLFVTGAIFDVETCAADAGRLSAKSQEVTEEGVVLTAEIEHEATVPDGFLLRYVLTQTDDLVIINLGEEPTFTVEEDGRYRIHSFVFPEDLDLSVVELGETTGFDVNNLINDNDICADLFVTGAIFDVETCAADAGRLSAKSQEVTEEGVVLTAEIEHEATVPDGFLLRYVLTQSDDLVIINLGEEPTFTVEEDGRFRIHSFVFPEDLDLSVVELGETTGFDVNNLINDNDICADLFVTGAIFDVEAEPCTADAGRLSTGSQESVDEGISLMAEIDHEATVPDGFLLRYVLTQSDDLVIINLGEEPTFTVEEDGRYRIHSFVFPEDLDLSVVELGETTGFDVVNLYNSNDICADLFVTGAIFDVEVEPCTADAGRLSAGSQESVDEGISLMAEIDHEATVPDGFLLRYVLTQSDDLVIINLGEEPTFTVEEDGRYRIHSFVFPEDLDLSVVELGETTGFDVVNLYNSNDICADLFVTGAIFDVEAEPCTADAGRLSAGSQESVDEGITLMAEIDHEANVPDGFLLRYVLTSSDDLIIIDLGESPEFTVAESGRYRIHSFVFPEDLDLSVVELGETTGFDVVNLYNSNDICADLFVTGALFDVEIEVCEADAGTLAPLVQAQVDEDSTRLIAIVDHSPVIPNGFVLAYVLTRTDDLIIEGLGADPRFTVSGEGRFRIHSFVFPETLDLSVVEIGITTGVDVLDLLITNDICADLDVAGAIFDIGGEASDCEADAGSLTALTQTIDCLDENNSVSLDAVPVSPAIVPTGFTQIYVLTSGEGLVIEAVSENPSFTVDTIGRFTIHTLVYDPNTLDLSIVEFGVTTGVDVVGLIEANGICADLDVAGSPFDVEACDGSNIIFNLCDINMVVYPNPTAEIVNMKFDKKLQGKYTLQIINGQAVEVYNQRLENDIDNVSVDVRGLVPGVYYLMITDVVGNRRINKIAVSN